MNKRVEDDNRNQPKRKNMKKMMMTSKDYDKIVEMIGKYGTACAKLGQALLKSGDANGLLKSTLETGERFEKLKGKLKKFVED